MSTVPTTPLAPEELRRRVAEELESWEAGELAAFLERRGESKARFLTGARNEVDRVYGPEHVADTNWEDVGLPGRFPYTRGPYPTMYRSRPWTMRQIAGFGTPQETNQRFHYLIAQGQTGISVDFDMPTLMGYDSDDPKCIGEVGREGVAIDVLDDMEALFDGIDLEEISVSMTINPSAWILLAMYIAVAEERGLDFAKLSGTIQNDIPRSTSRRRSGSTRRASRCGSSATRSPTPPSTCPGTTRSTSRATTSPRRGRARSRRPPSRWPPRAPTCAR